VIWVVLRELKRENGPCNLVDMFRQIHLRGSPEDVLLAKTLWKHVDDPEAGETLFVLDGLDEIGEKTSTVTTAGLMSYLSSY
jgi:hypothetical protein